MSRMLHSAAATGCRYPARPHSLPGRRVLLPMPLVHPVCFSLAPNTTTRKRELDGTLGGSGKAAPWPARRAPVRRPCQSQRPLLGPSPKKHPCGLDWAHIVPSQALVRRARAHSLACGHIRTPPAWLRRTATVQIQSMRPTRAEVRGTACPYIAAHAFAHCRRSELTLRTASSPLGGHFRRSQIASSRTAAARRAVGRARARAIATCACRAVAQVRAKPRIYPSTDSPMMLAAVRPS